MAWLSSVAAPASAKQVSSSDYTRPHERIVIDGKRRINIFCVGTGSPTVLFEAGFGNGAMTWRTIQGQVGATTRACSYDRAGYGFSDPDTGPADLRANETDLARLLHSKAISAPVILVAHSFGGLIAVNYALRHRSDVSALILVDPAFAGQWKVSNRLSGAAQDILRSGARETLLALENCARQARSGELAEPRNAGSACLDNPPSTNDPVLHAELNRETKWVGRQEADLAAYRADNPSPERLDTTPSDRQAATTGGTLGDMPLAVLTATSVPPAGFDPADTKLWQDNWVSGHDRVAGLSKRGTNTFIPKSGHFIQLDQPDAVIAAVIRVVDQVRHETSSPQQTSAPRSGD